MIATVSRPLRLLLGALVAAAAAIHLALTPAHFGEQFAYGVFFLGAATFQLVVAVALVRPTEPPPAVYRAAVFGSLALVGLWTATRAVAPPLATEPEEVSFEGVLASGLELAALAGMAVALPVRSPRRSARPRRPAVGWGALIGLGFALLFGFASSTIVYQPDPLPASVGVPSVSVWGRSLGTTSPWIQIVLTRHLYVHGSAITLGFLVVAGILLAVAGSLALGLARCAPEMAPGRVRWLALAPALVSVPTCCGAPLAAVLGASVLPSLFLATPWILVGTTVVLGVETVDLARRWRRGRCPAET